MMMKISKTTNSNVMITKKKFKDQKKQWMDIQYVRETEIDVKKLNVVGSWW